MASLAISVADNFFSKQFHDLYLSRRFNKTELVNMAALRSKIPSIEALSLVIDMARPPEMCFDLKEEIRIQGNISSAKQAQKQIENDYDEYEVLMEKRRKEMLEQMEENNRFASNFCPTVKQHFIGHNCTTCALCKNRAYKFVRGPRGGSRRGEITSSDFLQDYYDRDDAMNMLNNVRDCKCCIYHQINLSDYQVRDEPTPHSCFDEITGEEFELISSPRGLQYGDVLPSFKIYPNTHRQSKLPGCYHNLCDCKCNEAAFDIIHDVDTLDEFRSYTKCYDSWGYSYDF